MVFRTAYRTPGEFSDIIIESDGEFLTGLRFDDRKDGGISERRGIAKEQTGQIIASDDALAVFSETVRWLDIYFSGMDPGFVPKYRITGMTPFRSEVTEELLKIPYGQTVTYGEIAKTLAERHGIPRMSAQAVGGAVGWNPIGLIIPCHRVIGSDGSLTGYGGGLSNKAELLKLERSDQSI